MTGVKFTVAKIEIIVSALTFLWSISDQIVLTHTYSV